MRESIYAFFSLISINIYICSENNIPLHHELDVRYSNEV